MQRLSRRHLLAVAAVAAAVMLVLEGVAEARVGGGQSFGSGRSSGGSSRGFGGGSDGSGELVFLLIRLVLVYPQVGVPLLVLCVGYYLWSNRNPSGGTTEWTHHGSGMVDDEPARPAGRRLPGRPPNRLGSRSARRSAMKRAPQRDVSRTPAGVSTAVQRSDTGFSRAVVVDFIGLTHRRAWEAVETCDWDPLAPFVAASARAHLESQVSPGTAVQEVVLAGVTLQGLNRGRSHTTLTAKLSSSRREGTDRVYREEIWTFRRANEAVSLAPDATRRMGCPSCGSAVQTNAMGSCTFCGTAITEGQLQWQAVSVQFGVTRALPATQASLGPGGRESGYDLPTVVDSGLPVAMRAFSGRHPDFDLKQWEARVHHVFFSLQTAWSDNRWDHARPYVSDTLYNTFRFWLERYQREGLANRLGDVKLLKMQVVRLEQDAWYDAITVRFWASMTDHIEETRTGKVVGGNAKNPRQFSEYWTFLRAVGSGDTSGDPAACPSCGAPLDRISQAGVCGYCDSLITTGQFDWVLSRIDQPETYEGGPRGR